MPEDGLEPSFAKSMLMGQICMILVLVGTEGGEANDSTSSTASTFSTSSSSHASSHISSDTPAISSPCHSAKSTVTCEAETRSEEETSAAPSEEEGGTTTGLGGHRAYGEEARRQQAIEN